MNNIQFISHSNQRFSYLEGIEFALKAGCKWIQLRMKDASDEEFIRIGKQVRQRCNEHQATFIVNDRVELVDTLQADGVHLGKQDMSIQDAQAFLKDSNKIIGGTANTLDDIIRLHQQGANYVGLGPFRYTSTKRNLSPIIGLEGYRKYISAIRKLNIHLPIIAIGGITKGDIHPILSTGASGIAVSGAILNATDPMEEMKIFLNI